MGNSTSPGGENREAQQAAASQGNTPSVLRQAANAVREVATNPIAATFAAPGRITGAIISGAGRLAAAGLNQAGFPNAAQTVRENSSALGQQFAQEGQRVADGIQNTTREAGQAIGELGNRAADRIFQSGLPGAGKAAGVVSGTAEGLSGLVAAAANPAAAAQGLVDTVRNPLSFFDGAAQAEAQRPGSGLTHLIASSVAGPRVAPRGAVNATAARVTSAAKPEVIANQLPAGAVRNNLDQRVANRVEQSVASGAAQRQANTQAARISREASELPDTLNAAQRTRMMNNLREADALANQLNPGGAARLTEGLRTDTSPAITGRENVFKEMQKLPGFNETRAFQSLLRDADPSQHVALATLAPGQQMLRGFDRDVGATRAAFDRLAPGNTTVKENLFPTGPNGSFVNFPGDNPSALNRGSSAVGPNALHVGNPSDGIVQGPSFGGERVLISQAAPQFGQAGGARQAQLVHAPQFRAALKTIAEGGSVPGFNVTNTAAGAGVAEAIRAFETQSILNGNREQQ